MEERLINELVSIILSQNKEIERLKTKIKRIEQYIDTYETYIKGAK